MVDIGLTAAGCVKDFFNLSEAVNILIDLSNQSKDLYDQMVQVKQDYETGNADEATIRAVVSSIKSQANIMQTIYEAFHSQTSSRIHAAISCLNSSLDLLDDTCSTINSIPEACLNYVERNVVKPYCTSIHNELSASLDALDRLLSLLDTAVANLVFESINNTADAIIAYIDSNNFIQGSNGGPDPVLVGLLEDLVSSGEHFNNPDSDVITASDIYLNWGGNSAAIGDAYIYDEGTSPNSYILLEYNGLSLRTRADSYGFYEVILPANIPFSLSLFDPQKNICGTHNAVSAAAGEFTRLYGPPLGICSGEDTDGDGLNGFAEQIIGTNSGFVDTDNDGSDDKTEVQQGTNPLDGLPVITGIIASADTPGTAVDICATNNSVIVADGLEGVSVFNVTNGVNPIVVAQVDTPGDAQAVACAGNWTAVADTTGGLALINLNDPPTAQINHQLNLGDLGGEAQAIAAAGNMIYVGTSGGSILAIEPSTGIIFDEWLIGSSIYDLVIDGETLYAITPGMLHTLSFLNGLQPLGSVETSGTPNPTIGRLRLFVGDDVAYVVHQRGYNTIDVNNPAVPVVIATGNTTQSGWKQMALNGSGLGVAAVGPNPGTTSVQDVSLYDTSDPAQTNVFLTLFQTPGAAFAVAIYNGLAYVADYEAGMHVVNYLAYDSQGVPPVLSFTTNIPGLQVEEGSRFLVDAAVGDDVQVRNVELLMDDVVIATDGSFPFQFFITAPWLADQNSFTLAVRATDTGGNSTTTATQSYTLLPDITAPYVIGTSPQQNELDFDITMVGILLNEAINPAMLSVSGVTLLHLGPDGLPGGGNDTPIAVSSVTAVNDNQPSIVMSSPLPPGNYQLTLDPVIIADLSGNSLATPFILSFGIANTPPPGTVVWVAPGDGNWNVSANWHTGIVPGPGDHVLIDRLALDLTVTYSTGSTTIVSLHSAENLTLAGGSLTVTNDSEISGTLTITTTGTLRADGVDILLAATGSTTLNQANLYALNGATVVLPGATSYAAGDAEISQGLNLRADGNGSVLDLSSLTQLEGHTGWAGRLYVQALNGGRVDLSGLTTFTVGNMLVTADGPDSIVDFFNLTAFLSTPGFQSANSLLEIRNGGAILMAYLTNLERVDLKLNPGGALATSQIVQFTGGSATIDGIPADFNNALTVDRSNFTLQNGGTLSLNNVTTLYRTGFYVYDGVTLSLPSATTYAAGENGISSSVTLRADGPNSQLDLSAIVNLSGDIGWNGRLYVEALNGGTVDLSSSTILTTGNILVTADGSSSVVDLSAMTNLLSAPGFQSPHSLLEVHNSGTIIAPNLTNLEKVDIELSISGTLATSQITQYTGGSATIDGIFADFSNAITIDRSNFTLQNGGTVNLNSVTNLYRTGFYVYDGVTLTLPAATTYAAGESGISESVTLRADGPGSYLDLSAIVNLSGDVGWNGKFYVEALNGGYIDLSNSTTITVGNMLVLADGTSSTVNLSGFTAMVSTPGFQSSNSSLEARNNGSIELTDTALTIQNVRVILDATGTIAVNTLNLAQDSTLSGNGVLGGGVTSSGTVTPGSSAGTVGIASGYTQYPDGILAIEIGGLTPGSQFDQLNVTGSVSVDGALNLSLINAYMPNIGDTFTIVTADSFSGTFFTVNGTNIGNGRKFQINYLSNAVVLEVVPE